MNSQTPTFEVLLQAERLKTIPYADKPLPQGGKIVYLAPEELEKKFNFIYTESLLGNANDLASYLKNNVLLHNIKNRPDLPNERAVLERLNSPLDCIVLCDMGKEVGHGLFASRDMAPNSILFLYSGLIENTKIFAEGDDYTYAWASLKTEVTEKIVSAKNQGGLSRFMQHLPQDQQRHKSFMKAELLKKFSPELLQAKGVDLDQFVDNLMKSATDHECADIQFKDAQLKAKLAVGNVNVSQTVIKGIPVVVCWTVYGIKKHEQIGFSYGPQYWHSAKMKPRYFTNEGSVIPLSQYTIKGERDDVSIGVLTAKQQNPLALYQEGVAAYKDGNIESAKDKMTQALAGFKVKKGEDALECGHCYSTLASCYRELKQETDALDACEKALIIYHEKKSDKLPNMIAKYHELLRLSPSGMLYKKAVELYKRGGFLVASYQLHYALGVLETPQDQASCHSTLASCYRELKLYAKAIEHSELALALRKTCYAEGHELIKNIQTKLAELQKIAVANTKLVPPSLRTH